MNPSLWLKDEHVEIEREPADLPGEQGSDGEDCGTFTHLFETREVNAVNTALASGRPLLVRGEPGVGKSQLARAAAVGLRRPFVSKVIDARMEARDLLWTFDAVRRLADAQVLGVERLAEGETVAARLDETRYVSPGPLWWGFSGATAMDQARHAEAPLPAGWDKDTDTSRGVVVLLDEIDKANSSVPNGLLECLGNRRFPGPKGTTVSCKSAAPLVILTTNEERSLPDAFLRRCIVLQLALPTEAGELSEWLEARARAHFGPDQIEDEVLSEVIRMLIEDREAADARNLAPPGGAELLDQLRALALIGQNAEHRLRLVTELREFTFRKHPEDVTG